MLFKETGFRPIYHYVCAFELNSKLRELIRNCPDAVKSSHAVFYGYIDHEKGLMLELLGAGKQAPKYFYFKEPYEGERVSIHISEVEDVEFIWFEKLENRFYKKFLPRIEMLEMYETPEDVKESRTFGFLDDFREQSFPDDVKVQLIKEGLKTEECWVRITGLGNHRLIGVLLNQPFQNYGVKKGDTINFSLREKEDKSLICVATFAPDQMKEEDLEDGTVLKKAIERFSKDRTEENFLFALRILRSSQVFFPASVMLSEKARGILDALKKEGKDLDSLEGEQEEIFAAGIKMVPEILESEGLRYLPVFSAPEEIGDRIPSQTVPRMPFLHAIEMATEEVEDIEGIVLNAFTDDFVIHKDLFDMITKMPSLVEGDEETYRPGHEISSSSVYGDSEVMQIAIGKMDLFNYALLQNDVHPIRGIQLLNRTDSVMEGLSLRIVSDGDFFDDFEAQLPPVPCGKPVELDDPQIHVNRNKLAELTETEIVSVTVAIFKDDESICECRSQMKILAYDQWQGGETFRDLLAAFVLPNHPVIPTLMHDAAGILKKWGKETSFEGYQMQDPNRVRELAAAAYGAIQKKSIVYAEPPASFTVVGQRIRTPESIMDQRLGTCMDMTLLYAACLEAMGLHPVLVLLKGHIFAGVWLKKRSISELRSGSVTINDLSALTSRINTGTDELTFIECTTMCAGNNISFEESERIAKANHFADEEDFQFALDLYLARRVGIRPLPFRTANNGRYQIDAEEKAEEDITKAPEKLNISIVNVSEDQPKKAMGKKELWESKLLDLSSRNMLLNLPRNASIEPIMSSHIDELEDALADGHEFHLLPAAEWITSIAVSRVDKDGKESKPVPWLLEAVKEYGVFELTKWPVGDSFDFNEKFRQEFRSHRLYTFCGQKQLDRELTKIYRSARASQQENGVSSLYLAIGLLRWFADPADQEPSYAPLILLPIEIVRKSANQGYGLHARDEEPHFNTTLLELLRQMYNIEIPGVDPLPADDHGVDIKKTFAMVRGAVYTLKNWDVIESCVIGNFSFARFAMWNDIHTAGDMLERSDVVRSLMKGHIDWQVSDTKIPEGEEVYLPITVDATQLKAIRMAFGGKTFVLHGPPGTGKSQTITAMIANLMAQGKTVLFVAEKMAALSVVERRLTSLGIGDFCLELHSDKASKKQVLAQLEKALAIRHPSNPTEYAEYLNKTVANRGRLDEYAGHLHEEHTCGYSLRALIDLYETARDYDQMLPFDRDDVGTVTKEDVKRHLPLINKLIAAGEAVGDIASHPLRDVGLTSFGADVRGELRKRTEEYLKSLSDLQQAGEEAAKVLEKELPQSREEYDSINNCLRVYFEKQNPDPLMKTVLQTSRADFLALFERERLLRTEEQMLRQFWNPQLLQTDVRPLLEKYNNVEKKKFGKAAAASAVTNEVQAFAYQRIRFEQIPVLLQRVAAYQQNRAAFQAQYQALPEAIKNVVARFPNSDSYNRAYETAAAYRNNANAFPGGLEAIWRMSEDARINQAFGEYRECYKKAIEDSNQLNELLSRTPANENWIASEGEFFNRLTEHMGKLKDWSLYNQVRQDCIKAGIKPVVEAYENAMDQETLVKAYKKGFYYALINHIISHDDVLSSFSGATFNESIQQFKRLDEATLKQAKSEIFYKLAKRVPTAWDSAEVGAELNLLRKAIGSNARGISIRTLFERIPHVLRELAPCMMMSPNSVAQYLAQKNGLFDVVIFDEASQLPTCKAVGALARANSAVIVGDPKQMPPTSFFAGGGPSVEDLALEDLDSILDDALALGIPSHHLQWHYRSKHESLIAFSNNEFYGNKMFTFPSANDRERHVRTVPVKGVYKSGTNVKEAEAVVAEIVRRFHDPELKKQSLGVVTFNVRQQALIEDLLAKQFLLDPKLDAWANSGEDPLFVKNLENVQGDERDVILFSIAYGPDEKGRISMNFGPINQAGGGKRLNVAFSRSRADMVVFTSIASSDLRVTENSPEGVVAFRDFLRYAEGHGLPGMPSDDTPWEESKDGILRSICRTLEEHGYQCEAMVGHSDFQIDIAVIDPFEPSKYLMGIMLDGEGYRRTENTRDREVAQIGVLKNLGWKIRRVWTIDWWDNRENEIRKILRELDQLKAASEERNRISKENAAATAEKNAGQELMERLKKELEAQAAEVLAEGEEQDAVEEPAVFVEKEAEEETLVPIEKAAEEEPAIPAAEMAETQADEPVPVKNPERTVPASTPDDPVPYVYADLPETKMSAEEYAAPENKEEIIRRIGLILQAEAPILKEVLIRRLHASFGISKGAAALAATEKAIKSAGVKAKKYKGIVFCWQNGQDPDAYTGIRVSNERSADEICMQEMRNAASYVLSQKGELTKDNLVKEMSLVFGYRRLGKNLEAALAEGVKYARSSGAIEYVPGGLFRKAGEQRD